MKKLLFVFVVLLILIICCNNKEKMNSSEFDKEIISITPMELIDKLNTNERKTINDYKNYRIQITDVIAGIDIPRTYPIVYDESGNQMVGDFPISSYIYFGGEKLGWLILFYFNDLFKEIHEKDLHIGDIITVQGNLENAERYRESIPKSLRVDPNNPIAESEIQYRDYIYIFINDCVIIEVNGIHEYLLPIEGSKRE